MHASAGLDTYYGRLSTSWKVDGGKLTMDIEIPANTSATVYIPATDAASIMEGGKALSVIKEDSVDWKGRWLHSTEGGVGEVPFHPVKILLNIKHRTRNNDF